MNNKVIKSVKEELLKNIKCHGCGAFYKKENVQIKSLGGNKSFIIADCTCCGTCTEFQADIYNEDISSNIDAKNISNGEKKFLDIEKKILSNDLKKNNLKKIESYKMKNKIISNSVIKEEEINAISFGMKNFSSFKNFFSIALVFSFIFTGCADTAEENRQNILDSINSVKTQAENAKIFAEDVYVDGKEKYNQTKELIKGAPEKIEEVKSDIEKITKDAVDLKKNVEEKIENTKNAIDETKKAVDAVSNAMDSINSIGGSIGELDSK